MKTRAKIYNAIAVFMFIQTGLSAQSNNDPSYSTSNYKHPNKAEYARKIQEMQPVVYLEEVKELGEETAKNSLTASNNYKTSAPSNSKIKRFKLTEKPAKISNQNYISIPANYKMPFSSGSRKEKEPLQKRFNPDSIASIN